MTKLYIVMTQTTKRVMPKGVSSMETEAAVTAPEMGMAQALLDFELGAVLKALPGVTSVSDFPTGGTVQL